MSNKFMEDILMLVNFKVQNFKNFKDELVFKLEQVKNYEFNTDAIKDGIVKTALIYGENGSGKSNLGLAILDISLNLTDKEKNKQYFSRPFINLLCDGNAKFYYKFRFSSSYIVYQYEKDTPQHLVKEEVIINDKRIIFYDHQKHIGEVFLKGAETLNTDIKDKNSSFVKYIRSNAVLTENDENDVFNQFIYFVDNMLFFPSLDIKHHELDQERITQRILE